MAGEGMTLPWIAVDRCVRSVFDRYFNLRLRSLGNELILLGQMHQNRRMKPIELSQIFLSVGTVIPDRSVDAVVTYCRQEDHQRAHAITEQANLAVAFPQIANGVDSVLDVLYAGSSVIS